VKREKVKNGWLWKRYKLKLYYEKKDRRCGGRRFGVVGWEKKKI
jgi:hypothetical protein